VTQGRTTVAARHGAHAPRGQEPGGVLPAGRFGRMFPHLPASSPPLEVVDALADALRTSFVAENGRIPAGYTYLGQFIDHDITFDPTSNILRRNDPHALVNFRSPRFDLDSVYGGGPAEQPFLYDWRSDHDPGVRLLVDHNPARGELAELDLPRNRQGRALIGDARNDENLIISQLHLLFIRFHNKVAARLRRKHRDLDSNTLFARAQRTVRWHYQWLIVHDFLPRIVSRETLRAVVPRCAALPGDAVIPVEFSAAAFRFGHSMVRSGYRLQLGGRVVPIFGSGDEHLGGFRPLRRDLTINWSLFYFGRHDQPAGANLSMRIDPALAPALLKLPPDKVSLPRLNLHRGCALGLPSGSDVAAALGCAPLTDEELLPVHVAPKLKALRGCRELLDAPPLWYYILCEAYAKGGSGSPGKGVWLGPVGGRIVAAVLVGLLERDPRSYLHQPQPWRPDLGRHGHLTMRDLVRYVEAPEQD
jgi:hypothetical protein